MGSAVLEWMNDHGYHPQITRLGVPVEFIEQGTVEELHRIVGIDCERIAQEIKNLTK